MTTHGNVMARIQSNNPPNVGGELWVDNNNGKKEKNFGDVASEGRRNGESLPESLL